MNSLTELINISNETMAIAKEVVSLMDKVPIEDYPTFTRMLHRLAILSERLTFSEDITLIEMAQNNYEFLDTLKTILSILLQYPNNRTDQTLFRNIMGKTDAIIDKIDSPPFLQHLKRTPSDETEPALDPFISVVFQSRRPRHQAIL